MSKSPFGREAPVRDLTADDVQKLGGKVVSLTVSDEELTAVYDWIREGDSPKTIGHVCDVLKRILGGG